MYRSTVITSMLIPQSDGHMTRPIGEYLSHFKHLVATGLPIILYVAPSLVEEVRAPNAAIEHGVPCLDSERLHRELG